MINYSTTIGCAEAVAQEKKDATERERLTAFRLVFARH